MALKIVCHAPFPESSGFRAGGSDVSLISLLRAEQFYQTSANVENPAALTLLARMRRNEFVDQSTVASLLNQAARAGDNTAFDALVLMQEFEGRTAEAERTAILAAMLDGFSLAKLIDA